LIYEGVRALEIANAGVGAEPFARQRTSRLSDAGADDASQCDAWIRAWTAQSEVSSTVRARIDRISGLHAVGLSSAAQAEALDAAAEAADRPLDLHLLARSLAKEGFYAPSIHTALRLASASPDREGAIAGTGCVGRLVYPLAYGDLVQSEADRYGLDPYLFLALLRQESWFNPRAHSSADARGLSQVIPSTATGIARDLRRSGFTQDDLYRPHESIAFGARYFSQQIDFLGGRPLLALAAYNGGGGNALRWAGQNRQVDPDEFVDAISFTETRNYVRSITEIYAHYRHLYP
jgi:soluble lytic murein transglycosylase